MPIPVVFDTDIGTDVDDILALALILASPELELKGITTVHADVALRAKMALKFLALRGITNVPVMSGLRHPLLRLVPQYWEGHEGQGLLVPEDEDRFKAADEHAVDFLVRIVMDNPGTIHLIGVGPMTNVATALIREPRLAQNVAHLTVMGGVIRSGERFDLPIVEHNIRLDPEAAHIVFTSGIPLTIVPLDVTTKVFIHRENLAAIRAQNTPYHDALAEQLESYPAFARNNRTMLHDPLAVAAILQPDLLTLREANIHVETEGRYTRGATLFHDSTWVKWPDNDRPGRALVATEVAAASAEQFIAERLAR